MVYDPSLDAVTGGLVKAQRNLTNADYHLVAAYAALGRALHQRVAHGQMLMPAELGYELTQVQQHESDLVVAQRIFHHERKRVADLHVLTPDALDHIAPGREVPR